MHNNDADAQAWTGIPKEGGQDEGGQAASVGVGQSAQSPSLFPFEFRGSAREYFKIWVVNLALTLLTLGIYSPWAKVRKLRYFYGNTYLDGSSFEFLGKPIAILKGRILAVLVFALYWGFSNFYPIANLVLLPMLAILFPWVMVKSFIFRSRNSAFRNITFSYHGNYWQIALAYLSLPLLMVGLGLGMLYLAGFLPNVLSSGPEQLLFPEAGSKLAIVVPSIMLSGMLAYPYFHYLQKRAYVAPRKFGDTAFAFVCGPKAFYRLFLKIFFLGVLALIFGAVSMGISSLFFKGMSMGAFSGFGFVPFMLIFGFLELFVFVAFVTLLRNLVISALQIGEAKMSSQLRVGKVFMLYLTNIIAIVCSLGLLTPWAKVRLTRYQMETTSLYAPQGTQHYTGRPGQSASAIGEELAEIFDMDIAI